MIRGEEGFCFGPKYTHQVFQKDEIINGYQGLFIVIYLSAATLRPCLSYYFESQDEEGADDISKILGAHFGENCKLQPIKLPLKDF